jgi:CHASE2 domain
MSNRSLCDAAVVYLLNKYTRGFYSDQYSKVLNYILIFRAAIFVGCVVHIPVVQTILTPLNGLAYVVLANVVQALPDCVKKALVGRPRDDLAVVFIDGNRYAKEYLGRSPLPRHSIKEDLEKIYAANPKFVAIDLDLSPTFAAMKFDATKLSSSADFKNQKELEQKESDSTKQKKLKELEQMESDSKNQAELDELLDRHAKNTILITPFAMDEGPRKEFALQKLEWMKGRCSPTGKKGEAKTPIVFAEPHLRVTFGYVIEYFDTPFMLGSILSKLSSAKGREFLNSKSSPCKIASESIALKEPENNIYLNPERWRLIGKGEGENPKIHFRILDTGVPEISLSDVSTPLSPDDSKHNSGNLAIGQNSISGKIVLIGANYGQDDLFLTPVGEKYGVNIHAAIFDSKEAPMREFHWLNLILDVAFGILFGILVHSYWGKYFEFATSADSEIDTPLGLPKRQLAHTWLFKLIGLYLLFLLILIFCSFCLLSGGLWLNPISIAIGMLVHGFAESSVNVAKEQLRELRRVVSPPDVANKQERSSLISLFTAPCLMWIGFVGFSIYEVYHH